MPLIGGAIAYPVIGLHVFFHNRNSEFTLEVSQLADDLLTQMYQKSKKPAPPSVPVPPAAPPGAGPGK